MKINYSVVLTGDVSTKCEIKSSSNISKGEIAFIKQLHKWLGEKCGCSAQDFHRHCDHKGPTVVLVKGNDNIFGVQADKHWK